MVAIPARSNWAEDGLLGAVTARAEAHVTRLSLMYALLDEATEIGFEHLQAGLSVWRYCADSARYVFEDSIGDPIAERILAALAQAGPTGLSRTELRDHFGRHKDRKSLQRSLIALQETGLAQMRSEPTSGRPVERWHSCDERDLSDKTHPDPSQLAPMPASPLQVATNDRNEAA